jgi:hypothetical protein
MILGQIKLIGKNMKLKKYLVSYSAIGGGAIEIEAHSRSDAEQLFWDSSDEELSEATDCSGGLQIEYMNF